MRVVVDEGVPRQIVEVLRIRGIDASRFNPDWIQKANGALIAAVEAAGYTILLTNDRNIANQQSLKGRSVSVVALPLNRRAAIMARVDDIAETICLAKPGWHLVMSLDGSRRAMTVVDGKTIIETLPRLPPFKT